MVTVSCNINSGWEKPKIVPFAPLKIHPFNSSLHYAVQCFEGMKAYKDKQGKIRLFRP
jgi:branched-subunit amino acid aminotransferase/4-amino-4-deoxychorismate lyase